MNGKNISSKYVTFFNTMLVEEEVEEAVHNEQKCQVTFSLENYLDSPSKC